MTDLTTEQLLDRALREIEQRDAEIALLRHRVDELTTRLAAHTQYANALSRAEHVSMQQIVEDWANSFGRASR